MTQQFSIFWITPLNCGWQNTYLVKFLAPAGQLCIWTPLIKLCYCLLIIDQQVVYIIYQFFRYTLCSKIRNRKFIHAWRHKNFIVSKTGFILTARQKMIKLCESPWINALFLTKMKGFVCTPRHLTHSIV